MKNVLKMACVSLALVNFASAKIVDGTAISEPSANGQIWTGVKLRYDENVLLGAKFEPEDFVVKNGALERKITHIKKIGEHEILLVLSKDDENIGVTHRVGHEPSTERKFEISAEQIKPVTQGKTSIKPSKIAVSKMKHEAADDFIQRVFKSSEGVEVRYNLFVPKDYDPSKKYPLVMFIHDAGATNSNVKNTLYQGNGATIWATPSEQAKRPAFVLAPQFDHVIVNDNSDDPADLEPVIELIKSLAKEYSIDENRLYTTGQSGGGMMSIAMNIKYPDFFAASYLVACQWDAKKSAAMAKNNLFILISQNDSKAKPGQDAITAQLQNSGGIVRSAVLDAQKPQEWDKEVKELLARGGNIGYMQIKGGTLPLEKSAPEGKGSAHLGTWGIAYDIEAIREWLFSNRK